MIAALYLLPLRANGLYHRSRQRLRPKHDDRGQATAEYALVLLGAAVIALLVVAWATGGAGGGKIGQLLNRVFDAVISKVR